MKVFSPEVRFHPKHKPFLNISSSHFTPTNEPSVADPDQTTHSIVKALTNDVMWRHVQMKKCSFTAHMSLFRLEEEAAAQVLKSHKVTKATQ